MDNERSVLICLDVGKCNFLRCEEDDFRISLKWMTKKIISLLLEINQRGLFLE